MGRKPKSLDKVIEEIEKANTEPLTPEQENLKLKQENENFKTQLDRLTKMVEALAVSSQNNQSSAKQQEVSVQEEQDQESLKPQIRDISPNEYIPIMSLCNNKLNLSTRPHGQGKHFSFLKFGEVKKNIFYSDLLEINENHPNFLEAGYYYILDDDVVKLLGLGDFYDHILTKDQINKILVNSKDAIELFQKANPKQQKLIIDFLVEKINNNEPIDFNLINKIKEISGMDINQRAQMRKEANADLEVKK